MSRSNYGKPFYVDVGTSIVAIRCASNRDVLVSYDFAGYPFRLKLAKGMCDRMNSEFEAALKREKSAIEADALAVGGIVEAARRGKAQFGAASGKASLNIAESRSGEEGAHPKTAESSPGAKGWNTPSRENLCSACRKRNCKGCPRAVAEFMPAVRKALSEPPRICDTIPADKLVDEFCNRFMESCEGVDDKEAVAQYKQLFMQIHLQDFVHWVVESLESEVAK